MRRQGVPVDHEIRDPKAARGGRGVRCEPVPGSGCREREIVRHDRRRRDLCLQPRGQPGDEPARERMLVPHLMHERAVIETPGFAETIPQSKRKLGDAARIAAARDPPVDRIPRWNRPDRRW